MTTKLTSNRSSKPYSSSSNSVSSCPCTSCQQFVGFPGATPPNQHPCSVPGCGKIYSKSSHLKAHLRWHVSERTFTCNWTNCGKRFGRSDELQRHVKQDHASQGNDSGDLHVTYNSTFCTLCDKQFPKPELLVQHLKVVHNQQSQAKSPRRQKSSVAAQH